LCCLPNEAIGVQVYPVQSVRLFPKLLMQLRVQGVARLGWWKGQRKKRGPLNAVAIGNPERYMRKASHCGSKQQ